MKEKKGNMAAKEKVNLITLGLISIVFCVLLALYMEHSVIRAILIGLVIGLNTFLTNKILKRT
ncbi:hypothetical protein [Fictibacillus sp. 18YEL24]|uniref:hypothetical protein n=1 Tax=Fictibacillus sp. 18YEL24 TaxID=2745875 RepID=UPI0018CFE518|nr:hypothetical protein [Fictibacillus sp. 18YEL24]MBH0171488.1 hypothetical protein [Fictibacillus sp. 18YEL24]